MAVKLASDIVVDVMRNADPARRLAATNRLQSAAASPGVDFAAYAEGLETRSRRMSDPEDAAPDARQLRDEARVFRDFERVFLHNLFEMLLPKEDSGSFGSGPSASVWRSMSAEQLAGVYAESGGAGITDMLAGSSGNTEMRRDAQWPYFVLDSIDGFRS